MVLPGFHDTHVHPVTSGIELGECNLNPAVTLPDERVDLATMLRAYTLGGAIASDHDSLTFSAVKRFRRHLPR